MAQPTIVLRSEKGVALTWAEGDANITNLAAAALPTGGAAGDVLIKTGTDNYAVEFGSIIDDTSTTSTTKTWSADKLYTTLGDIEAALAAINGEA